MLVINVKSSVQGQTWSAPASHPGASLPRPVPPSTPSGHMELPLFLSKLNLFLSFGLCALPFLLPRTLQTFASLASCHSTLSLNVTFSESFSVYLLGKTYLSITNCSLFCSFNRLVIYFTKLSCSLKCPQLIVKCLALCRYSIITGWMNKGMSKCVFPRFGGGL